MTFGFGKSAPPPPVREDVIWTLTKGRRGAHAGVRCLQQHGYELRIYMDGQLVISHLHRFYVSDALLAQSAAYLGQRVLLADLDPGGTPSRSHLLPAQLLEVFAVRAANCVIAPLPDCATPMRGAVWRSRRSGRGQLTSCLCHSDCAKQSLYRHSGAVARWTARAARLAAGPCVAQWWRSGLMARPPTVGRAWSVGRAGFRASRPRRGVS